MNTLLPGLMRCIDFEAGFLTALDASSHSLTLSRDEGLALTLRR